MAKYKCSGVRKPDEDGNPSCTYEADRPWRGRCPSCARLRNIIKVGVERIAKQLKSTADDVVDVEYIPTGVEGFDKVAGGGLVAGCVVLFGGEEGAGKTTLSMMIADGLAKTRPVIYASAEQSDDEVIRIAKRVGVRNKRLKTIGNASNIHSIIEWCEELRPVLTIFDSIQMMSCEDGPVGGSVQGEQVANVIRSYCKKTGMCAIAVNQLSRSGYFKGSTAIGHMVDTLMYLDKMFPNLDEPVDKDQLRGLIGYENPRGLRKLISGKNRNSSEANTAYLEMSALGILETVRKKSKLEVV